MTSTIRPAALTAATPPAQQSPLVTAHDGASGREVPVQVGSSTDAVLRQTVANASTVMDFLKTRFNRNGLDGKGMKLDVVVHAEEPGYRGPMNNAFWDGQAGKMYIGDGDGTMFQPLGLAKDVIAHEVGHAILESEVKMGFDGQEGALHESFGDVMGSLVDPDDWQIGEDVFTPGKPGDALRDMSKPQEYDNLAQVPEGTHEPHLLADIPNLAAVRVAQKIGREAMGDVWYDGFTTYLKNYAQFSDAARATVEAAEHRFGKGSTQASAVTDAWKSVGVLQDGLAAA